jgi:fatty acid desaturase
MAPPENGRNIDLRLIDANIQRQAEDLRELKAELKALNQAINERDRALEARETERVRQEKAHIWTGIKALIAIIGILWGVIWLYRATIIGTLPGN